MKKTISIKDENGKDIDYEVLLDFILRKNNKRYLVYTDNTKDENGNTKVYASVYNPNSESTSLEPIETDKEWKIIETILSELQNQVKQQMNENNE